MCLNSIIRVVFVFHRRIDLYMTITSNQGPFEGHANYGSFPGKAGRQEMALK